MSIFKTQKSVDQERAVWEAQEAAKTAAARMTEGQRFSYAVKGLARLVLDAEASARASDDEAAEVKAVALRRRLGKVEKLHADYQTTAAKVSDAAAAVDAAREGHEKAMVKVAAKLESLLPGIRRDEALRLVNLHVAPSPERREFLAAQAVAGALTATRMRLAREMWALLESSGGLAIGADSGARGLVERGRGQ